jgi:zinc-binding in reverse transcriptase
VLWKVKDGRTCRFWTDSWLEEGCVLSNEVDITVWEDEEEAKVADFVIDGGEDWDWSKLQALPDHLKFQIEAIKPPQVSDGMDTAIWGLNPQGKFTTLFAYNLLTYFDDICDRNWEEIWKWKGPQRVKTFLWLSAREALLTNKRRARMGLTDTPVCPRCQLHEETTIHVLRDYIHARCIWE